MSAPERIWASGVRVGSWNDQCVDAEVETEYVRADLYARLQEQVETLRKERDDVGERSDHWRNECADWQTRAEAAEAERDRLREENERLREACRIARLHAPIIRLAPERRHTISVLDAALQKEPQP